MQENPKFLKLLDQHKLKHDISPKDRVEIATRNLAYCPTNLDMYLLAFGDVPETVEQFQAIIDFVHKKVTEAINGRYTMSLDAALTALAKAGKTIYPKEE